MLLFILMLAACSDSEESKWVGQVISKEEKQPAPIYEAQVTVHTPISTITGIIVKQDERDKWILTNAQQVSGHPNVLVHNELMTQGEVEGIDEKNNIAIIHIRNSFDFETVELVDDEIAGGIDLTAKKMSYYETALGKKTIRATVQQIQALLDQTIEQPLTWQQRYKKNQLLQQNMNFVPATNYTSYYEKNIFTYNPDEMKHFAMSFINALNDSIKKQDWREIAKHIGSDDVLKELQFVTKQVEGFEVSQARKEGVFYFVTGSDSQRKEVRLTFILEQGQYQVIGTNLIDSDSLSEQKIAQIDLLKEQPLSDLPALQMFMNQHINEIKINSPTNENWHLQKKDKKIQVDVNNTSGENALFSCSTLAIERIDGKKAIQLVGCAESKENRYTLGFIQ